MAADRKIPAYTAHLIAGILCVSKELWNSLVGAVYEGVNVLHGLRTIPSSAEEGWLRDNENVAQLPKFAQTGWLVHLNQIHFLTNTTPAAPIKWLRNIFWMSRPPLLS